MTKLLTQNTKMAKSSKTGDHTVFNFGIPAYESNTGFKTCPMAGQCKTGCYARQGTYIWSNVSQAFETRLTITLSDNFIELMSKEITIKEKTAINKQKQLVIRIHDSGDFYNIDYYLKWQQVMIDFPNVQFYAYTKMLPMFMQYQKKHTIPSNFRLIYSEGGLADNLIDIDNHYHSRVFSTLDELLSNGYADCTENDLVAAIGDNPKIGLVYHGAKSKSWNTDNKEVA